YVLMQLPMSIWMDRVGTRYVMTACILLTVVGTVPLIVSHHWVYLLMGRALIGIGSSGAIVGLFHIIRMTFPDRHFSRMLSFSVAIGLLGAMYGGYPVSVMTQHLHYKTVVAIFCIIGMGLAGATYSIVPKVKGEGVTTAFAQIKAIFSYRDVFLFCCCSGLMVGPLEGFADVWGSEFLKQVYGFNTTVANTLPSLIFMGMCLGGPILSIIAEKIGYYLSVIITAGILMLLAFGVLMAGVLTAWSVGVCFVLIGICCAYQMLVIYTASTFVPKHLAGLTTTVANMMIMGFGYVFHTVIGFVIDVKGGIHSADAFMQGIWVIPIALAMGVLGLICFARHVAAKRSPQQVVAS
ncbi:MAG: MFS transporter, partial [Legionellaceae bacterium]